jgi:hypothetical protein
MRMNQVKVGMQVNWQVGWASGSGRVIGISHVHKLICLSMSDQVVWVEPRSMSLTSGPHVR